MAALYLTVLSLILIGLVHQGHTWSNDTSGWDWVENYKSNDEETGTDRYKNNEYDRRPYDDNNEDEDDDDDDDGEYEEDYQPSQYSRKSRTPDSLGYLNVYLRDSYKNEKSKRYKRHRLPVARYDRKRFPLHGPFINFLPWIPMFADRLTKQTIIYSPAGGVYILPPLINFFGKLISVAELIASGYASLVSTGVPPAPGLDVAPLVGGAAVTGAGVPPINPATGGFKGGVQTRLKGFPQPRYPPNGEETYY